MKTKQYLATGILSIFLVTGGGNVFAAAANAVAQGNISVYKNGRLADTFTGQNPVEDEALLVCNGTCMIRSAGVALVGADGSKLAIKNDRDIFNLLVESGRVDFVITDRISKVAFYTPDGQYTVADMIFNASTNSTVRGYMRITDEGRAEIGVNEGRMVFSTEDGAQLVDSHNRILLAMAEVPGAGGAGAGAGGAGAAGAAFGTGSLIAGGVVIAGIGAGVIIVNNSGGGTTQDASPNR